MLKQNQALLQVTAIRMCTINSMSIIWKVLATVKYIPIAAFFFPEGELH